MIRPVDAEISQRYGDNPTAGIQPGSPDYWIIEKFGNYQPDGHAGEDYPCGVGTPVRAVADGTVLHIARMGGTYADNPWWIAPNFAGYCAVIDHGAFIGIYGHCKDGSAKVSVGQRVSEGQVFILSGNTGGSTGPHLHFEILPDGYILGSRMYGRIDPETLFAGTVTPQSAIITPITPLEEGFLMALTDKQQADLYWILCEPDGREYLAELVGGRAADKTLNTPVQRGGSGAGIGDGKTSLAALVAWNDDHTIQTLAAIAAGSASSGASVEQIIAAVKAAIAESVVNVAVTVNGTAK